MRSTKIKSGGGERLAVAARHALRFDGPINSLHEAPALGNGDLGALVQVFQNEFRLHLGKNDIWDARFDHVAKDSVVTQDDLIRMSRDYGFRLEGPNYRGEPVFDRKPPKGLRYIDHGQGWNKHLYPCPKPAGLIRIMLSGSSSTRINTVVDLRTGSVTSEFIMDFGWHNIGVVRIDAFVDRNTNAVRVRITQERTLGAICLCVEKPPDSLDASVPPARVRLADDWHGVVSQTLPAAHGIKAFRWHLAGAFPKSVAGRSVQPVTAHPYRLWQQCGLQPGASLEFTVGVATDRDGPGSSLARAQSLAEPPTASSYNRARKAHEKSWAGFWDQSGIALEDKQLEDIWYRNLFALACLISPKAVAPVGDGNIAVWDAHTGHSGYTVNMNIQKMFLASLPTNHPEWNDCYANWLEGMVPAFRHLAGITFGLKGIHSPHWLFPFLPPEKQASSNQCGRALGMTGWHGQPLWWRWEYFRDKKFLRTRAYPYFKEAACFYWRYLKKYLDESGDLYPSLNLEWPQWSKDFRHNRDPWIDLILFRNSFRYAIDASRILNLDATWRSRWEWALSKIRPVRVEPLTGGGHWIYTNKNHTPPSNTAEREDREVRGLQAMAAAWTVFPGEYADGDEVEGIAPALRDIMTRNRWHELHPAVIWIHHWWCAIPALRMGLKNAFAMTRKILLRERFPAGHARTTHWIHLLPDSARVPEDNYLGVAGTTEMLLQSQGGTIRLFPAWPKNKQAAFRGLPARGGFVIAATWTPGRGLRAEVRSIVGETCRVRWPGKHLPRVVCGGRIVRVWRETRDILFKTNTNRTYVITGRASRTARTGRQSIGL